MAGERLVGDGRAIAELLGEMVGKAVGELKTAVSGTVAGERGSQRQRISTPAKR